MREQLDRKAFHTAVDTALSGLQENPFLYQRVKAQAEGKENVVVKKKLSVALVIAIVLMLLTATALAAGIIFAKRVPADFPSFLVLLEEHLSS